MINENMEQDTQSKKTNNMNNQTNIQEQDTTITKARSQVTTNSPAISTVTHPFRNEIFNLPYEMKKNARAKKGSLLETSPLQAVIPITPID